MRPEAIRDAWYCSALNDDSFQALFRGDEDTLPLDPLSTANPLFPNVRSLHIIKCLIPRLVASNLRSNLLSASYCRESTWHGGSCRREDRDSRRRTSIGRSFWSTTLYTHDRRPFSSGGRTMASSTKDPLRTREPVQCCPRPPKLDARLAIA